MPIFEAPALVQPVHGRAQMDGSGTATIGTYADGGPVPLRLTAGPLARHTIVVGAEKSGTSTLLRSILDGARGADIDAQVVDVHSGILASSGHPAACSIAAARAVLAEQHDLAHDRLAAGHGRPLRLLVVDDLQRLTGDPVFADRLAMLVPVAGRAGIAVLASVRRVTLDVFHDRPGTARTISRLLTHQLVMLRTRMSGSTAGPGGRPMAPIPPTFPDGSTTAGVGYLPRSRPDVPFRAWLP